MPKKAGQPRICGPHLKYDKLKVVGYEKPISGRSQDWDAEIPDLHGAPTARDRDESKDRRLCAAVESDGREVRNQRVFEMLTRVLYAGYVEHEGWGITLRKGQHDGLVDLQTYNRIQERLKGTAKAPARKDISADFPLRGFVLCDDCGTPLTACWSKSKTGKKHPYYLCPKKGCASYRKSIRRDQLEEDFEAVLRSLEPAEALFKVAGAMFKDAWEMRLAQARSVKQDLKRKAKSVEKEIETLLDRIVDASSTSVVKAFERKVAKLEQDRILIEEQLDSTGKPKHAYEESFELALRFLSRPWKIWKKSSIIGKKQC